VMVVEVNKEMLHARGESPASLFALLTSLDYRVEALEKPARGRFKESIMTSAINGTEPQDRYYDVLCLPKELKAGEAGQYFRS
jgi:hypothetical protein